MDMVLAEANREDVADVVAEANRKDVADVVAEANIVGEAPRMLLVVVVVVVQVVQFAVALACVDSV